jgi:hypothetical protein
MISDILNFRKISNREEIKKNSSNRSITEKLIWFCSQIPAAKQQKINKNGYREKYSFMIETLRLSIFAKFFGNLLQVEYILFQSKKKARIFQ